MAEIDATFDSCVTQLNTGATVEACLAQVPAETPEVAPLVQIAVALRSLAGPLPEIDAQARQHARSRFLSHALALAEPSPVTIEDALEESIGKLAAGASIDECLDAVPHHAAELGLLLTTVADLQKVGDVRSKWEAPAATDARRGFLIRATVLRSQPEVSVEDALDSSLQMLAAGATIKACLETFPNHAVELRALLEAVSIARRPLQPAPRRPRNVVLLQRQAFLTAASLKSAGVVAAPLDSQSAALPAPSVGRRPPRPAAPPSPPWWRTWASGFRQPAWRGALAVAIMVVLLLVFSRTAVTVASGALPGDALYPVKRLAEQTRLVLTADTEQRGQLQKRFDQTRREEAQQVATQGRQVLVQLPGVIASIDDDKWTIFGLDRSVVVPNEVILQGSPGVGKRVLILAWSDGQGNLVAHQITILEDVPHRKQLADTPLPPMDTATPFRGVIPIRPTRVRPTPTDPPRPIRTVTPVVTAAAVFTPSVTSSPVASITPLATSIATPPLTPEPPTLTPVLTSTPALPPSETPTSVPEPAFTSTATPEPSPATPEPPATPTHTDARTAYARATHIDAGTAYARAAHTDARTAYARATHIDASTTSTDASTTSTDARTTSTDARTASTDARTAYANVGTTYVNFRAVQTARRTGEITARCWQLAGVVRTS